MGKPEIGSKRVISVSSFTLHSCHARPPSGPPPPIAASIAPRTILSVSLAVKRTRPRSVSTHTRSPSSIPSASASSRFSVTRGCECRFASPGTP